MQKLRYRYRLYPHPHQKAALARRHRAQSIRFTRNAFRVEGETLRLSKVGSIPATWNRELPAEPSSVTLMKDAAGRYFASFVVEVEHPKLPANGKSVGVDLGLASLAVTSEGEKIAPPKFLRSALKRIRRLGRDLNRKAKGSSNRQKARLRLAKAHATVADQRLDHLHKLSTRLIRENQTVVLEDLNVSGMMRNRKLARAIADAGWRLLRKKALSVRAWRCSACGAEHHRDVNAARNILAAGLAERLNACGAESKTSVLASGTEAGTHLNQEVQLCPA